MNIDMADGLARYGSLVAAIIGLTWMIWQMSAKGDPTGDKSEESRQQLKFLGYSWSIFAVPAAVSLISILVAQAKSGTRGILASLITGMFITLFIASLETQASKKRAHDKSLHLTSFAGLPLAAIGISLLFMGVVTNFYGVNADGLWLGFIIGTALGLTILKLCSTLILYKPYQLMSRRIESSFLLVDSVIIATIMAAHHFTKVKVNAYLPLFILMGIFLALLISTVLVVLKPNKKVMNALPGTLAAFLAIFLGICLFLVLRLNLKIDYNYPLIAGAITSVIFIVVLYGSATSVRGVDMSAGALCSLLLTGGLWFSYKWSQGLGMATYSIGLLSASALLLPFAGVEPDLQENQPEDTSKHPDRDVLTQGIEPDEETSTVKAASTYRPPLWGATFLRAISLAGLAVLLLVLFRVFIQKSPLLSNGIDLTSGDTITALLVGVLLSLSFEGFNLKGSNIFQEPRMPGTLKDGLLIFTFSVIVGVLVLLSTGIFFRLDGMGALILGMSIPAILGVFVFFSQKVDRGLFRASTSPLWIGAAAYANFLVQYKDVPDQLTRLHKQQLVVGMILLIIVVYFLAHYQNRGKDKTAKTDHEREIPVSNHTEDPKPVKPE